MKKEYASIHPKTRAAWRAWLAKNAASSPGVRLVFFRATTGKRKLSYADAVEEALCFGWIDSMIKPIDDERYSQLFTPRKPKSEWSRLNKTRVGRLTAEGLMTPAGVASIERAKQNGSWEKIDHVEDGIIPPELARAFAKNAKARKHFDAFSPSARKGILHWLGSAKREETRALRVKEIISRLEQGLRLRHQTLPPKPPK